MLEMEISEMAVVGREHTHRCDPDSVVEDGISDLDFLEEFGRIG